MSGNAETTDAETPAEERLLAHLAALREAPPTSSERLVDDVVRHARWQRAVRDPLVSVGTFAFALASGLGLLFGWRPRKEGER